MECIAARFRSGLPKLIGTSTPISDWWIESVPLVASFAEGRLADHRLLLCTMCAGSHAWGLYVSRSDWMADVQDLESHDCCGSAVAKSSFPFSILNVFL